MGLDPSTLAVTTEPGTRQGRSDKKTEEGFSKDKEIEHSEEFIKSRRKHSAVESSINALENHGLDRCLDH
ncbi:MAG: hypothetical protein SWQ30_23130, partial [Thermodesulfobacteriota bacterium]|nr:hypothetical protein [Thermodesulfobacteriota bacterium]